MCYLNNKLNWITKFIENRMKMVKLWILCIDEITWDTNKSNLSAKYSMIIVIFFNFVSTYHFYMCLLVKFSKRKERPNMWIAMKLITTHRTYNHRMHVWTIWKKWQMLRTVHIETTKIHIFRFFYESILFFVSFNSSIFKLNLNFPFK